MNRASWRWIHIKYEISRKREKMLIWLAWRLPRSIAYWAAIRVGCNATQGDYSNQVVPELYFMDALKRWDYEKA